MKQLISKAAVVIFFLAAFAGIMQYVYAVAPQIEKERNAKAQAEMLACQRFANDNRDLNSPYEHCLNKFVMGYWHSASDVNRADVINNIQNK